MLNEEARLLISNQFANEDYCRNEFDLKTKCSQDSSFIFFSSADNESPNNCGDYISFAVRKNAKRIEELFFSRQEACIIVISATNILCKGIIEKKKNFVELAILLLNIRRMINNQEYVLNDCGEIEVFTSLKSFTTRKGCLLLVVNVFSQIITK